MNFFEKWEFLNKISPPNKNQLYQNSIRRSICEDKEIEISFKSICKLLGRKNPFKSIQKPIIFRFNGGLDQKVNAGKMLLNVLHNSKFQSYQIIDEHDFFNKLESYSFLTLISRLSTFVYFLFKLFTIIYVAHKSKLLSRKDALNLWIFKATQLTYIDAVVRTFSSKSFYITYNDMLEVSAEVCAIFRKNKLPSFHIQHGLLSEVNYPALADTFALWGEGSYRKALQLGFEKDQLVIVGAFCFSNEANSGIQKNENSQKTLLFFSQTNLIEHTGLKYCLEVKKWLNEIAHQLPEWNIIIRLHPNEVDSNFYEDSKIYHNISFQKNDVKIADAIVNADICATIWSGAGLDTLILNKPLLVFSPLDFGDKNNWIAHGCHPIYNYRDLDYALQNFPDLKFDFVEKQREALKYEIYSLNDIDFLSQLILSK